MQDEQQQDEQHGQGGTWIVENGVRRLAVPPTQDHPEGNRPRPAETAAEAAAATAETEAATPKPGLNRKGTAK